MESKDERFFCMCGGETVISSWNAWEKLTGNIVEIHAWTCETPGCSGNQKEKWSITIDALTRLTQEE